MARKLEPNERQSIRAELPEWQMVEGRDALTRTLKFAEKHFGLVVPEGGQSTEAETKFIAAVQERVTAYTQALAELESMETHDELSADVVLRLVRSNAPEVAYGSAVERNFNFRSSRTMTTSAYSAAA